MDRTKLLQASDEQIIDEVKRLQYLFRHQTIIRNGLNRCDEIFRTQSVAEHIYNMFTLVEYFLPLEDKFAEMNIIDIHRMVLWHDSGELETGDICKHKKTLSDERQEKMVGTMVLESSPQGISSLLGTAVEKYEAQDSREARFVKALDRLEAEIYLQDDDGKRMLINFQGLTLVQLEKCTEQTEQDTKEFPSIHRFGSLLMREKRKQGYYKK